MDDLFSMRLRQAREHLGLTIMAAAAKAGLKNRNTWTRYEAGQTRPDADALAVLLGLGIDINWLLTGDGDMIRRPVDDRGRTIPVLGMAQCGLDGWYQDKATGLFAAAPAGLAADQRAVAVFAAGNSMRPAGICPGDLVFCDSGTVEEGGAALVILKDGKLALKRWGGATRDGWCLLHGWLDAENGVQMPMTIQQRADQVDRILRVVHVQSQIIQASQSTDQAGSDRHYEIAIAATLRWYHGRTDMDQPDPQALAAMISRAARMLAGQQDQRARTDAELAEAVTHLLDLTRDMLATSGWKPK